MWHGRCSQYFHRQSWQWWREESHRKVRHSWSIRSRQVDKQRRRAQTAIPTKTTTTNCCILIFIFLILNFYQLRTHTQKKISLRPRQLAESQDLHFGHTGLQALLRKHTQQLTSVITLCWPVYYFMMTQWPGRISFQSFFVHLIKYYSNLIRIHFLFQLGYVMNAKSFPFCVNCFKNKTGFKIDVRQVLATGLLVLWLYQYVKNVEAFTHRNSSFT